MLTLQECIHRLVDTGFERIPLKESELSELIRIIPPGSLKWGRMPLYIELDQSLTMETVMPESIEGMSPDDIEKEVRKHSDRIRKAVLDVLEHKNKKGQKVTTDMLVSYVKVPKTMLHIVLVELRNEKLISNDGEIWNINIQEEKE